ncbi:MAG: PTS sorbose transporter subunit IIC [Desulfuromonadales bacterium]|nr:PTS sorbose transporter subunit IIC [Desulfuromonadales bacterium]NIR34275.1 PTS sorbose transporter subunit IIC [Desulfuromonadales bacterium]NIS42853.1 PTS sorbose transporter subunit IIC [Desulfuromonadales bacterium]
MLSSLVLAGAAAFVCGLDRTAALQVMISRPIVAAPLTGLLLGEPMIGLQVGALMELLWLGRLPLGAAIPPDDTQVAVGATFLAIALGTLTGLKGLEFTVLSTLIALPLGKAGQYFDRAARHWNSRVQSDVEKALDEGNARKAERQNWWGVVHFGVSSLGTFAAIALFGSLLLFYFAPIMLEPLGNSAHWIRLVFPLIGVANILGTINVSRSLTLFGASFTMTLLLVWLI